MSAALLILRRVPPWVWVVLALLGWGAWQRHRAQAAEQVHTRAVAAAAAEREAALQADAAETARRLTEQKGITDEARKTAASQTADALRARTAEQRLRARISALAAGAGASNPAPTDGSTPASEAVPVLADMLGRCGARVRELAEYADAARAAGETCERSYESLTRPK